jgi:hypothetical protein
VIGIRMGWLSCGGYVVDFSCKARAVCPSCLGRRMNEGAANLGVLSSHSKLRSQLVPKSPTTANAAGVDPAAGARPSVKSRYIPWAELH